MLTEQLSEETRSAVKGGLLNGLGSGTSAAMVCLRRYSPGDIPRRMARLLLDMARLLLEGITSL